MRNHYKYIDKQYGALNASFRFVEISIISSSLAICDQFEEQHFILQFFYPFSTFCHFLVYKIVTELTQILNLLNLGIELF